MCDGLGVLTRELRMRVLNISESGCLIESQRRLEVGTVGTLRLQFGIEEHGDDIQVVRYVAIRGAGSVYHLGIQFLQTTPRHARSIRHAVRSLWRSRPQ
jgi:hypothetical protein